MKTRSFRLFTAAGLLAAALRVVAASDDGYLLDLASVRVMPKPTASCIFNSILPENDGTYIAIWDDAENAILERRDSLGTQVWQRTFATGDNGESTRAVLTSASRTLWCSPARWVFIDNATGTNVAEGTWDIPELDATKLVIQGDTLYVVNGLAATTYDTNMNLTGTIDVPERDGCWRGFDGNWLVNLSDRTNNAIGVARLNGGLDMGTSFHIPIDTTLQEGYSEHRVLGHDGGKMAVATTVNTLTNSSLFCTYFDAYGIVINQTAMSLDMVITGSAVLSDGGWLVSGMALAATDPPYFTVRLSANGTPKRICPLGPGLAQRYVVLNTSPPQVLRVINPDEFELYRMVKTSTDGRRLYRDTDYTHTSNDFWGWWDWWWEPVGLTYDHFWQTPTRLNIISGADSSGGSGDGGDSGPPVE